MLEPFSFTEDKRKEITDTIEGRVRVLEDEHVSFSHNMSLKHLKQLPSKYENILKDASLTNAIRTLETKDPAVSHNARSAQTGACVLITHLDLASAPVVTTMTTDPAFSPPCDRTGSTCQGPRKILSLALHTRRDLLAPPVPTFIFSPCCASPSRCAPASRSRIQYAV